MKRLIALVLAGLMVLGGVCFAAGWPEGRSAAQPYSGVPEVNLEETMGYILLFPRAKLPVSRFCDELGMYLPREDLALGEGVLHLYEKVEGEDEPVEVCTVDFANKDSVLIRDMTEKELSDLMWGGGTCVEMFLPKSLEFGAQNHNYFVLMDAGCYTANDGKLKSLQITNDDAWVPVIEGDYGVSGLYYTDGELPTEEEAEKAAKPVEEEVDLKDLIGDKGITDVVIEPEEGEEDDGDKKEADATEEPEPTETPEPTEEPKADEDEEEGPVEYVVKPDTGDRVHFDLVIGGDAKLAVLYSDNGSVEFDEIEYAQSGVVEGTVLSDDVQWGVAFYDANDYIFDTIDVTGH